MSQNARVDRGHCDNHLLYKNTWGHVRRGAEAQIHEGNVKRIFIDSVMTSAMFTINV